MEMNREHVPECRQANAEHVGPREICICDRMGGEDVEGRKRLKAAFLVVFMTARLVIGMPWSDVGLVEAGSKSAPLCVGVYCMPSQEVR